MPSSSLDKTQSLDELIICGLSVGALLALSILSDAPFLTAAFVIAPTIVVFWLYFQILRPRVAPSRHELSRHDVKAVLVDVADSMPRAITVLDRYGDVIHANSAAKTVLSPDIIGRPLNALLGVPSVQPNLEIALNGDIPPSLPTRVLKPSERHLDVDFSKAIAVQSFDRDDAVIFAVLADRTQAAKERELRADFLANASHELKTPIASMKGFIETLRGHAKDDPVAREKFLGIMAEQADRMERLVTDLLSLRRIESGEHIAPSEMADLKKAIETAQDSLELLADRRDVKLSVELPDTPEVLTSGKTDECIQLFLNLMENAIKLSPKGTAVRIQLEKLPSWSSEAFPLPHVKGAGVREIVNLAPSSTPVWRAIITDEGPGFSKTHLPRIGERFYRVAGDLPAQEKGTGLGLAIVKHIILRHRAGLFVQSLHAGATPDKSSGTSFSVVFAAVPPVY